MQDDPFSGLKEGTHSFIDRSLRIKDDELKEGAHSFPDTNVKVKYEDFPFELNEEHVSRDNEESSFLQALNEEIDHEMLNGGMKFECV